MPGGRPVADQVTTDPRVGCANATVSVIGAAAIPTVDVRSAIGAMVRASTAVRFAVARLLAWSTVVWIGEVLASPAAVMATRMPSATRA